MTQQALTIRDLKTVAGEPHVQDLLLGERLGFGHPVTVRKLIRRHKKELYRHGEVVIRIAPTSDIGGRPSEEYLLNEAQALVVCMHAQTNAAVAVRAELINVFMAYRRGELVRPVVVGGNKPKPDQWAAMERRLSQIEKMLRMESNLDNGRFARAIAYAPNVLFLTNDDGRKRRQRRQKWWSDMEVREAVCRMHRQMPVDVAVATIAAEFGRDRAPSRSSLHRFWQTLDAVRAVD